MSTLREELAPKAAKQSNELKPERPVLEDYRALVEEAPDGVITVDLQAGEVTLWNRTAVGWLSSSSAVPQKLEVSAVFAIRPLHNGRDVFDLFVAEARLGDEIADGLDCFLFDPTGVIFSAEVYFTPLELGEKKVLRGSVRRRSKKLDSVSERVPSLRLSTVTDESDSLHGAIDAFSYNERWHQAIRLTNTGIFDHDHRTGTVYRSREILSIYGWSEELTSDSYDFLECVAYEDREGLLHAIACSHDPKGDGHFYYVYRAKRADGSWIWCESRADTFFEGEGENRRPVRTVGAVVDITERKSVEETLRNSSSRFQAIIESTSDIVFALDRDLRYIAFNRNHLELMQKMYGIDIYPGAHSLEFILHEQERKTAEENARRGLAGERFVVVQEFGDESGDRSVYESCYNPIYDSKREIQGVAVFMWDVTERRRAQESLSESEMIQRLAIDATQLGIWRHDLSAQTIILDGRAQEIFGVQETPTLAQHLESFIHPEDLEKSKALLFPLSLSASSNTFRVELRIVDPEESVKWVEICGSVRGANRSVPANPTHMIGTILDITERKRVEASLAASELRYRTLIETCSDAIFIMDDQGQIKSANRSAAKMHGYSEAELQTLSIQDIDTPESASKVYERMSRLLRGEVLRFEAEHRRKDGTHFPVEVVASTATIDGQKLILAFDRDITQRKHTERQVAESLREKEAMLKEIHHRVKNNLQVISSLLNLQSERIEDTEGKAVFQESQNRIRAMALVHETLYGTESFAEIEMSRYLQRLCESLLQTYGGTGRIRLKQTVEHNCIDIDRALPIGLIVSELVTNAIKHGFPDNRNGLIEVSLRRVGDHQLQLVVSDDGVGFQKESSNAPDSLGLYLVDLLTRQLRGTMEMNTANGGFFSILITL